MKKIVFASLLIAAFLGLVFILAGAENVHAQERIPCKEGEVLTPDGRCLMPACPAGYALDQDYVCVPLGPECRPGRPCYAEPLPGKTLANPLHNLNCKPVRLQIEPACLKSEGCIPEPGVAASLIFTMLVKCSKG